MTKSATFQALVLAAVSALASCGGEEAQAPSAYPTLPPGRAVPPPPPLATLPPPATPTAAPAPAAKPQCTTDAECPRPAGDVPGTIRVCEAQRCVAKPEAELMQWASSVVSLAKAQKPLSPGDLAWVKSGKPMKLYVDLAKMLPGQKSTCVALTFRESAAEWRAEVAHALPDDAKAKCKTTFALAEDLAQLPRQCAGDGKAPDAKAGAPSSTPIGGQLVRVSGEAAGRETLSYVGVKGRMRVACEAIALRRAETCTPRDCRYCKLVAKFEEPGADASADDQVYQVSGQCDACPADRSSDKARADHVVSHGRYVQAPRTPLPSGVVFFRNKLDCAKSLKPKRP